MNSTTQFECPNGGAKYRSAAFRLLVVVPRYVRRRYYQFSDIKYLQQTLTIVLPEPWLVLLLDVLLNDLSLYLFVCFIVRDRNAIHRARSQRERSRRLLRGSVGPASGDLRTKDGARSANQHR